MTASSFRDFVERKTSPSKEIDWSAHRDEFLGRLALLYAKVNGFLEEFIREGQIAINQQPIDLHEEYIGSYQADQLRVEIGTSIVTLTPIGTLLVGSPGRVDMQGPGGSAKLVLAPADVDEPRVRIVSDEDKSETDDVDWQWKIVTYSPRMQYIPLSEQAFRDALMAVADA